MLTPLAFGQTYTIQSVAGGGLPGNVSGLSVGLAGLTGVALDTSGNLFMTSLKYQGVLRLDGKSGLLALIAGNGMPGFSGDNGPAINAQFNQPQGIAVDQAGNIYVSDSANNRVRRISNGVITTIAGKGTAGSAGDNGPAVNAELNYPYGIALDGLGNVYIADLDNRSIRQVSGGTITTVEHVPQTVPPGFTFPYALAVDAAGDIYFTTGQTVSGGRLDLAVYELSKGQLSYVAGFPPPYPGADPGPLVCWAATGPTGACTSPQGLAVDSAGNIYFSDVAGNCVRELENGIVKKFAGTGVRNFSPGDGGPAASASLTSPSGVAIDGEGNVFIADAGNGRLRKVSNGIITTIAGGGTAGQNGLATSSELYAPLGLAADSSGNIYFVDSGNLRVGKLSSGAITLVAGNGTPDGFSPDGTAATDAAFIGPSAVALDSAGNTYIADNGSGLVREVSNGLLATVGEGTKLSLSNPSGVLVDKSGHIYVSNTGGNSLVEVANGVVTTIAPLAGYPKGLALDAAGDLYIAATLGNLVSVFSNGLVTPWAGNGAAGFSGDGGLATAAQLSGEAAVAVGPEGSLYIADTGNNRIRKVTNGVITTIAGTGSASFSGDGGPALNAALNAPAGVAVDGAGNVYVSDSNNNRIRELIPAGPSCSASVSVSTLSPDSTGGNFDVGVLTARGCAWAVQGLPTWVSDSGSALANGPGTATLTVTPNSGDARSAVVSIAGIPVFVTQQANPSQPPSIDQNGVVPLYSTVGTIQPGEWVSIYGSHLASGTSVWNGDFPISLGGTSVTIDGLAGYLWYVSLGQINLQVPDGPKLGPVTVVVTTPYGTTTATVQLSAVAPAFLLADSTHVSGIILRFDGSGTQGGGSYDFLGPTGSSLGYPTVAAKAGDTVELFGVGFGPTSPVVLSGTVFSGAAMTTNSLRLMVGGVSVTPSFAGLTEAGLYQINLTVPAGIASGDDELQSFVDTIPTQQGVLISIQ